ncbi:hypothetical protein PFICI_11610 [Pestalotiopsis fici W106-1]|uniref:Peptidase S33 tripeptidyl aminopeptidase-like C-terminal domain-containing protein n=1 Tax=Pestalotiopsis fici (strain W106-1 / CGMCC3.15140) TaxID=1229662 RepID=W3WQW4_PESFW|nr:uncharacterized protein PFICI_11610 [Pestalotiopsis fici W106-1]ETS76223.1 hypothetical protein PFICI_11610 [Pestalotiopsis fici W106-1]
MLFKKFMLPVSAAFAVSAKPLGIRAGQNSTSGTIEWGACEESINSTLPIQCGTLTVPLDYTNVSDTRTIDLALLRIPSLNTTSKGSILFNFGGPGAEARNTLVSYEETLMRSTGGEHDLIAFDPRGTAEALAYNCYPDPAQRPPAPVSDSSDKALGEVWAIGSSIAQTCLNNTKDTAPYIGTAFVARDMMQIVDALGEDGMLRYWGISYGTVLGATVAAMFPDRMDKLLLDGVVNCHNYYHKSGIDVDQLLSADSAFTETLRECIEAGELCALSQVNSTALELQATLLVLAEDIRKFPIAIDGIIIDYAAVINLYYLSIRSSGFQSFAPLILNLLNRENLESIAAVYRALEGQGILQNPDALLGIKGGDTIPRYSTLDGVLPTIDYMKQTTSIFWGLTTIHATLYAQWPFEAKERYEGDFNVTTPNPVLFLGNTYDPATPLASAYNMSATFEESVVLEQHGFGHSSLSQPSNCTASIIGDYFVNGKSYYDEKGLENMADSRWVVSMLPTIVRNNIMLSTRVLGYLQSKVPTSKI